MTSKLIHPVLLVFLVTVLRFRAEAAVFIVSNNNDSGAGSLRQAIEDANLAPDHDTISFNIPGATPVTISPGSALPALTSPVLIDGTTQPGYAGEPVVGLVGTSASTASGLVLQGGNSEVRGLFINRFSGNGIQIQSQSNAVYGCFIGTSPAGTARFGNNAAGVAILSARYNRIGGTNSGERNILSGNQTGLWIAGNTATGNSVQGNFIGTDITGTTNLGNGNNGLLLSAPGNIIGGTTEAARNIISGNGQSGVYLNDAFASNNWVCGNFIGLKVNGAAALSNTVDGITVFRAARNLIGGAVPGARNIISGNGERGVYLFTLGGTVTGNRIEGNWIGTDATGQANLGNRYSGVGISSGNSNVVGGTNVLARNVISANKQSGVAIESNSVANIVAGNYIGLDALGANALANGFNGVSIASGTNNVIGGVDSSAGNVISGNTEYGVRISGGTLTLVQGNRIGTDASGQIARGNALDGVRIESAGNLVGGDRIVGRNVISGNGKTGVSLLGLTASNNTVSGNFIGTDATGAFALRNVTGVALTNAPRNFIGSSAPLGGNLISGNGDPAAFIGGTGVEILGSGSTGNRILGNLIGSDVTGTSAIPNRNPGIYIGGSPANYIGGTESGEGNLISGNANVGVYLVDPGANGNVLLGNYIGTCANGTTPLPNVWHGVEFNTPASGNILGGTAPGAANRIAYAQTAGYDGVRVRDGAVQNMIRGNTIFDNAELAIDLSGGGLSPNDSNDPDSGANNLQNFPVLTSAIGRYITTISGILNSRPNAAFTIDFYGSDSISGQGGRYIGSLAVNTAGNNASFSVTFTNALNVGGFISATATDAAGNTSEYSPSAALPPSVDTDSDLLPDDFEMAFGLNPNSGADGHIVTEDGMDHDLDSDGDGASNYKEFLAGTKPNDAGSVFRVSMQRQAGRTLIFVDSVAGATYRIETATDVAGPWSIIADGLAGTGAQLQMINLTGASERFYKVRRN